MVEREKEKDDRLYDRLKELESKSVAVLSAATDRIKEMATLLEENKRLRAEITELRERDRWIPVGEKLPEESGKYLVQVSRIAIEELGGNSNFVRIKRFMGGEWAYGTHSPAWINGQLKDTVTHWKPLPATDTKGAD